MLLFYFSYLAILFGSFGSVQIKSHYITVVLQTVVRKVEQVGHFHRQPLKIRSYDLSLALRP